MFDFFVWKKQESPSKVIMSQLRKNNNTYSVKLDASSIYMIGKSLKYTLTRIEITAK